MKIFINQLIFWMLLLTTSLAEAHEVRPSYLQLTQVENDQQQAKDNEIYEVIWKQPLLKGKKLRLTPMFPDGCRVLEKKVDQITSGALIKSWQLNCKKDSFVTQPLLIKGLSSTLTDVLLIVNGLNGKQISTVLTASKPDVLLVQYQQIKTNGYFNLGLVHLLLGFDHILFIMGLMLFVQGFASLLKTITAFTIAHSMTLAVSTLNIVQLSSAPVEAAIALSILFLAYEASSTDKEKSMTFRAPWRVAFLFGLLHGFGFSSALFNIGLPQNSILQALLFFNLGVEVGQIVVISILLSFLYLISKWREAMPPWLVQMPVFVLGSVSSYWLFKQLAVIIDV